MRKQIEYQPGQMIGRCVFINEQAQKRNQKGALIRTGLFVCPICGKSFTTTINSIKTGNTISCGCYRKFIISKTRKKHGLSKSPIFTMWMNILTRCYNNKNDKFKNYGARGITVCDEWKNDFMAFYNYVTQLPYYGEPGRSIDRYPDNDGNYEPENLRWATASEQNYNSRRSKNIC